MNKSALQTRHRFGTRGAVTEKRMLPIGKASFCPLDGIGRHTRLKILRPKGRPGSSPGAGTI